MSVHLVQLEVICWSFLGVLSYMCNEHIRNCRQISLNDNLCVGLQECCKMELIGYAAG